MAPSFSSWPSFAFSTADLRTPIVWSSTLVGTGGPLVDPADTAAAGEPAATPDASYPACTRTVTDNCVQTYERRRRD